MKYHRLCQQILFSLLLALPVAATGGQELQLPERTLSIIDNYIYDIVLADAPGAALVIVDDGKIRFIKGYGVRNTRTRERVTDETVFRLASVSKGFASAAAGLLVHENRLSWDEKVKPRLEYVRFKNPEYARNITLRNLLSHTTGLIPHAYTNLIEDHVPYRDILRRLRNVDFACRPGKCYTYQNVAFSLVGDLIQDTTGSRYENFVTRRIFTPLQMHNASFGLEPFLGNGNTAVPHKRRHEGFSPIKVSGNFYNVAPAAGANASARDMAQWLLAQLGHRQDVLPDTLLGTLHSPAIETRSQQYRYRPRDELGKIYYGLGWRIFDYGPFKSFVHHSGGVEGARADMVFNRRLQTGMVFLSNSENPHGVDLVFLFLDLLEDYHLQKTHRQPGQTLTLQSGK